MTLTNQDLCKKFNEKDGGDWRICFDEQARVFFMAKKKDSFKFHVNKNYYIPLNFTWHSEKPNAKQVKEIVSNFDWTKIYDDSIGIHMFEKGQWIKRRTYIHIEDDLHYSFILPRRIENIIEKEKEKNLDDGRGGK